MIPLDVLYISLSLGFLVLVGFFSYTAYQMANTLKSMNDVLRNVEDITHDVQAAKDSLKHGTLSVVTKVTRLFRKKGGD